MYASTAVPTVRAARALIAAFGNGQSYQNYADLDLRSPRNLADRAQQLGMVPAKSMAFVRISDGSIIGVAQPAKDDQRLNVVTSPVAPPPAPPPAPTPDPAATATTPATAPTPTPTP